MSVDYCGHGFQRGRCPQGCGYIPAEVRKLVDVAPVDQEAERIHKLEETVRQNLGIQPPHEHTQTVQPLRRFYQPLPEGSVPEWSKEVDGLSTENIAMFLTLPEVLYTNYEKNKNNPPSTMYITPQEAFDHPCWKGLGRVGSAVRTTEWGVPHIGTEIVVQDKGKSVQTDGLHATFSKRRGKLPMPPHILTNLAAAKRTLEALKKRKPNNTDEARRAYQAERRAAYRGLERWQSEKTAYEGRGKWGWIPVPKAPGRASFKIEIKPCPEGSHPAFPMRLVEDYIRAAYGSLSRDVPELWRHRWSEFENKVIRRAWAMRVFRGWPDETVQRQKTIGWQPEPGEDYGTTPSFGHPDAPGADDSAREKALRGYRRRPDGSPEDETIRHNNKGMPGSDWKWGVGHGPYRDERDQTQGYESFYED